MSSNCFVLGVPLAVLVLCGTAAAGPKPVHSKMRPAPVRQIPAARFGPEYSYPQAPMARVPNMTRMPDSHLVAGIQTDRSGPVYTDTRGRAIGRMDLTKGRVVWFGNSPAKSTRPH